VNIAIAFSAARFAIGRGQQSSRQNEGLSAQMMQSGWGTAGLILMGLGLAAVGCYDVYKGASKKFLKDLRVFGGSGITAVGVAGYVAKSVILAGAGVRVVLPVIIATLQADPSKARGFDAAVKTLGQAPFGRSYSLWPPWASRRSARTALCAGATAAEALRCRAAGQRLIQGGDLHRLDRRVAAVLQVDQRRCDTA
jgi:uncharacterized protein DUF1206